MWHLLVSMMAPAASPTVSPTGPRRWAHLAAVAMQFLTRIPVRLTSVSDDDLRGSQAFFPLVGAVVAAVGIAVRAGLQPLVGAAPATVAAVAAAVVVTGAFHEDGLADTADGLWGGWTPERRIEIMRDSRVGTYGAVTLIASLLYQVMLLAQLPLATFATVMLAGHVIGRAAGVALAASLAPVSDQGLGAKVAGRGGTATAVLCSSAAVAAAVLAAGWWFWAPLVAGAVVIVATRALARAKLGGLTGDVLGAVTQATMLAVMTVLVALWRHGW